MTPLNHRMSESFNAWGNDKERINPDEYCVECERDVRNGHYDFCPALMVTGELTIIEKEKK